MGVGNIAGGLGEGECPGARKAVRRAMRQGGAGAGKAQLAEATDPASPSCFSCFPPSPPDRYSNVSCASDLPFFSGDQGSRVAASGDVAAWQPCTQSLYACGGGGGGGAPSRMRSGVAKSCGGSHCIFLGIVFLLAITYSIDLVCHLQSDGVLLATDRP